jgi:hypothetical protein
MDKSIAHSRVQCAVWLRYAAVVMPGVRDIEDSQRVTFFRGSVGFPGPCGCAVHLRHQCPVSVNSHPEASRAYA